MNKILTQEQLMELFELMKTNKTEAEKQILLYNQGLVKKIASKYYKFTSSMEFEDLMQEGNIGLLNAIRMYDYTKTTKFSSYIASAIENQIRRSINNKDTLIRIPVGQKIEFIKYKIKINELEIKIKRELTDEEKIQLLEITPKQLATLNEILKNEIILSTDELLYVSDISILEDTALDNIQREEILKYIEQLKPIDQEIIKLKYGFTKLGELTYKQIADKFQTTKQNIHQKEKVILKKLKANLSEK